jgi:hypothetical protein
MALWNNSNREAMPEPTLTSSVIKDQLFPFFLTGYVDNPANVYPILLWR